MNGVKFIGDVTVKQVMTQFTNLFGPSSNINYRVHGAETDQGVIDCEYFVNCGGIWAREIGKRSDPPVKVHICPGSGITTITPTSEAGTTLSSWAPLSQKPGHG